MNSGTVGNRSEVRSTEESILLSTEKQEGYEDFQEHLAFSSPSVSLPVCGRIKIFICV